MKKFISYMFVFCSIFLLGIVGVRANFWNDYFNRTVITPFVPCGDSGSSGVVDWKDTDQIYSIEMGGCGSNDPYDELIFRPTIYSENLIFNDVTNVKVTSSNEKIIKGKVTTYDYSKEKANYTDFVKWYNALTFEEFNKYFKEGHYEDEVNNYKSKPTWWEYNGFTSEPKTWWEAYGFTSEPKNSVEVTSYAYDLGKAYLTLSADNKENIKINWEIRVLDFASDGAEEYNFYSQSASKKGLIAILNDLERYKDIISKSEYYDYNFAYQFNDDYDDSDISDVINTLKGKNVTIDFEIFDQEGLIINGLDIKENVGKGFSFNYNISSGKYEYDKPKYLDKINALAKLKNPTYIDFSYSGKSQFPINVKINLYESYDLSEIDDKYKCEEIQDDDEKYFECDAKVEDEKKAYFNEGFALLRYDYKSNTIEVVKKDIKLSDDAYLKVNLTFDDFSNYVLVRNSDYEIYDIKSVNSLDISGIKDYVYTGKNIIPNIIIKDGETTLVKDIDYKISYKNNKNIGTATVTITGMGRYNGTITKDFKILIDTPKKFTKSTQSTSSITLKWSKPTGKVTGYQIYMKTSADGKYSKIATISKSSTKSYKKTKLSAGKTYYFKIRTYYKVGKKNYYSDYIETSATTSPKSPSIKVSSNTNSVTISWKKISGATSYEVYQSTDKKKYTKVAHTSDLSVKIDNLKSAKTYYYKVKAVKAYNNQNIKSSYSKVVSTTTKPLTPSIKVSTKSTSATIKWNKISGASGYEIYQSTNGKKYSKIKTITKGSTTSYTKTKLSKAKGYYYKVRAYKKVGSKKVYSGYSASIIGVTTPSTPSISKPKLDGLGVKISYKKVSGVTGYEIYASTDNKNYVSLGTTKGLSYVDTKGEAGVKYYYKVRSYKEVNGVRKYSGYSKVVSYTKPVTQPQ